jgi:putative ABC transport system permease protein
LPIVTILSYDFWQRRFGGDPSVVGSTIRIGINGRAEIVGVLPEEFELLLPPRTGFDPKVDMWTALRLNFDTAARGTGALRVIGRIKPGVSTEQAQDDAARIAAGFRERFPVKKTAGVHFRVVPIHEDLVKEVRPTVLALFGAVVFVLSRPACLPGWGARSASSWRCGRWQRSPPWHRRVCRGWTPSAWTAP